MAPCRDSSIKVSQLYSIYCSNMSPLPTSADIKSNNEQNMATTANSVLCCYPDGECLKMDAIITADQLNDCVRVICNNENCLAGEFMHRQCFDAWEQGILVKAVGGNGRAARQWTERQRNQNLWSKKGFELVHKVCQCKCGSGHIRKDLDWVSPLTKNAQIANGQNQQQQQQQQQQQLQSHQQRFVISEEEEKKKRKKRNRNHANQQQQQQQQKVPLGVLSSNNVSNVQQQSIQIQHQQQQMNGKQMNDINGDNVTTAHPNIGVIGSGLQQQQQHNNNNNSNNMNNQLNSQQQQQIITSTLNNLLNNGNNNNNNILGLDLRTRASSLSSGADGGSGTTSPSTSQTSGELLVWKPIQQQQQQQTQQPQQQQQQMHHLPLLTHQFMSPETVSLQQQQQQQHNCLLQQHHVTINGISKSILNGITSNVNTAAAAAAVPLLMKSQIDQQKQQQVIIKQQLSVYDQQHLMQQQKNKEVELYSERVRATSGCNGIFSRRLDFSSFNQLPKTRLNSYQVKIEDEGNHGNDETRLFILSSLAQSQMSRVACILCEEPMLVFDRYPLVDGSFFLSPKQHSPGCIEVKYESRVMYLTCVCMSCLDGTSTNRIITCRFCGEFWDGSNLVLGTMYAYDIFAAMPCCNERIKCNHCSKLLLHPQQRLNFYSDYSHAVTCQHCGTQDTHFVKPLNYCYIKGPTIHHPQIA